MPVPGTQKASFEDVIRHTAALIRMSERSLVALQEQARQLDQDDTAKTAVMMVEIGKVLTRRRTLIEVWEYASNAVWHSPIVNNQ